MTRAANNRSQWLKCNVFFLSDFDRFGKIMASRTFRVSSLREAYHKCDIQRTWRQSSLLSMFCPKILWNMCPMQKANYWSKYTHSKMPSILTDSKLSRKMSFVETLNGRCSIAHGTHKYLASETFFQIVMQTMQSQSTIMTMSSAVSSLFGAKYSYAFRRHGKHSSMA